MVKAYEIYWDTDGENIPELPDEVIIEEDINEEDIADYLSDNYGFCVFDFKVARCINLGTFEADVIMFEDGTFDAYISHAGSSGRHYQNATADDIGNYVSEDVSIMAEAYQDEF